MLLHVNSNDPHPQQIAYIANLLRNGGVIVYPTDTVYALGCSIHDHRAYERVCRIRGIDPAKANFAIVCHDLSNVADYARPFSTPVFRVLKKALPGPFTFILEANNSVPKIFQSKKKTVGIRVPDNNVCRAIVKELGHPILTTSVHDMEDDMVEYYSDPEMIEEKLGRTVDLIVAAGFGNLQASTVVDCTNGFNVVREGLGDAAAIL